MGELGLFYRLCEIVFIGGSLIPHGGQNFLESFRLKTAVIIGNYMHNFKDMTLLR
jgi:3-deoxy-D-manno-octulosonic-acid transferase